MQKQPKIVKELVATLAHIPTIEKIMLFGSRARGDADPRSDIDIAVVGKNISEHDWIEVIAAAERLDTLLEIDVIRFNTASSDLKKKIMAEGVTIYEQS